MTIEGRKVIEINNLEVFLSFVKNIIHNLKGDFIPKQVVNYYTSNSDATFHNFKSFEKEIKKYFYNTTILNKDY